MQMLMVCCESGSEVETEAIKALDELGAPGYTICHHATGRGSTGLRREDPIWPGSLTVVHAYVADEIVPEVLARIQHVRQTYLKQPACCVFSMQAEKLL